MAKRSKQADVAVAFGTGDVKYLGKGTFGETWSVKGSPLVQSGAACAVKILFPRFVNEAIVRRETSGLERCSHEAIVRLLETVVVDVAGHERVSLVFEFVEGGTLADFLARAGPVAGEDLVAFARGMTGAVFHLHSLDLVHRDIKPGNVMLRDGDPAKPVVIDFGLSRGVSGGTLTKYPARVGTAAFMSPEQLRGERARKAGDVWATGAVLFVAASGIHPFYTNLAGLDWEDLLDMAAGPPKPLPLDVPAAFENLALRMLAFDPYMRGSSERAQREANLLPEGDLSVN